MEFVNGDQVFVDCR